MNAQSFSVLLYLPSNRVNYKSIKAPQFTVLVNSKSMKSIEALQTGMKTGRIYAQKICINPTTWMKNSLRI
jgi:hypothetical protein